ncbi:MAG TPA: hypothetical protein DCW90_14080 [Lachnospiraceae bacterium]|nr:hypothetical protein [uncultured Lachnoclostridium sp.]HAU86569.1 hypothetical protein [Lachnospiraceae bacterium]
MPKDIYSSKHRDEAPANKAADLNTAVAWLVSGDLSVIPIELSNIMKECREAIEQDEISTIELIYVHNLSDSINCRRELETAAKHSEKHF